MNYLQAHFCAAFVHSVPANITYCYGIALNKQILYCRPKRTSDGAVSKRTVIGWERDGRYPRNVEILEKMADIFHVPLTYIQPDQSLFIERAAATYGKKGKIEAQHLAFELTELFASGELTPQDMDGIMYEMHKAYFKYREQKREKERIMNL